MDALRDYRKLLRDIEDNKALLADSEMREMAKEELGALEPRIGPAEEQLKIFLVPRDPNDDKDVILEIRAGAGGDEAGLFAAELLRSYLRYAERRGWKVRGDGHLGRRARRDQGGDGHHLRRRGLLRRSSTSRASTACSACRPPRRRGASTPPPSPWR